MAGEIALPNDVMPSKAAATGRSLVIPCLIVLAAWAAMRYLFFQGFWGVDDFHHVRFAWFWDRLPQDHWETRLLFNGLLRAALRTLGFSEAVAALPSLAGSLMILLSGLVVSWQLWKSWAAVLAAGLVLAVLPLDVVFGTNPSARSLAAGFFTLGLAIWVCGGGFRSAGLAGLCFGLAILTHIYVIYVCMIAIAVLAVTGLRRWRHVLVCLPMTLVASVALDGAIWSIWAGDPLYSLHIAQQSHLANLGMDTNAREPFVGGQFSWGFVVRPVVDLLASKDLGIVGLIGIVGCAVRWRKLTKEVRALWLTAVGCWLWMSYGSETPTKYTVLPGTTSYWLVLSLPLILLMVDTLRAVPKPRRAVAMVSSVVAINLCLLMLMGPWGQGVKVSGELLEYACQHGDEIFVTDGMTLDDMYYLNGFTAPANVQACPGDGRATSALRNDAVDRNVDPKSKMAREWMGQHVGGCVCQFPRTYRALTYVLPEGWRSKYDWMRRRPAGMVCKLETGEAGK